MNLRYLINMLTRKISILFICVLFAGKVFAGGGFPLRPGRLMLSPSVNYFFANKSWDINGKKVPYANNGQFTAFSTYLYAEYGISKRFSAIISVPFIYYQSKSSTQTSSVSGIGDMETSLRYYLGNIGYKYYFTLQGTVVTPLYTGTNLGYDEFGEELRLNMAGSGKVFGKYYYFDLGNGVRQYSGSNGPFQDRYNGVIGLTLDKNFREQLLLGASGLYSVSSFKAFTSNLFTVKDQQYTQAYISYGHSFTSKVVLFLTLNQFVAGRNTGIGTSGSVSLLYKIDTK